MGRGHNKKDEDSASTLVNGDTRVVRFPPEDCPCLHPSLGCAGNPILCRYLLWGRQGGYIFDARMPSKETSVDKYFASCPVGPLCLSFIFAYVIRQGTRHTIDNPPHQVPWHRQMCLCVWSNFSCTSLTQKQILLLLIVSFLLSFLPPFMALALVSRIVWDYGYAQRTRTTHE